MATKREITIQNILARSHKAVCGIMEKEMTVLKKNAPAIKAELRSKGFRIIGDSAADSKGLATMKIWFIRRGGF